MPKRQRKRAAYMISAVAESYGIHPQTLRLYERQGLLKPSRTEGNTRLYTERDIERLEVILSLTRDLGVNLAGVEIVLNMREKMERMQRQMRDFVQLVQREMEDHQASRDDIRHALVRVIPRSRPVSSEKAKKRP